jgi:hypothetical protein
MSPLAPERLAHSPETASDTESNPRAAAPASTRHPGANTMTKKRPGYHYLSTEIPNAIWAALSADAHAHEQTIPQRLTQILQQHYEISPDKIPPRKTPGRKPKYEYEDDDESGEGW